MQKLIETLKSFGIDIPEDKQADVKKALSEHYKNAGEVSKTLSKMSVIIGRSVQKRQKLHSRILTESTRRISKQSLLHGNRRQKMQRKTLKTKSTKEILRIHSNLRWRKLNFLPRLLKRL